jgi:single-strand DNA-binding protein
MSNNITIIGNVTRDPELRFTSSGQATASFGIAVNRRWQNQAKEWEEAVSFFNVVCWRELAENVAESCPKGTRVMVNGRLDQRSWETPTGEKKSSVDVVADECGPSLRWASAQVTRKERSTNTANDTSRNDTNSNRPAGNVEPQHSYDEEPF